MFLIFTSLSHLKKTLLDFWERIYRPAESFRARIAQSSFWGFGLQFTNRGLVLVRTVILARLLTPRDFGLYGLAMILMNLVLMGSYPGMEEVLIQQQDLREDALDAAWTIRALRGLFVATVLYFGAAYAQVFFNEPEVRPLIQVLGLAIFVSMLRNPAEIYFKKDLLYQTQYFYKISARVTSLTVAVVLAVYLANAWALVLGFFGEKVMIVLMSYWLHPYKPRFNFQPSKIIDLLTYGGWLTGNSIVHYLNTKGDDFLVGKLLGTSQLGFYRIAFKASQIVPMAITNGVVNVFFPVFSKLQDKTEKLTEGIYKTFSVLSALLIPSGVGIFFLIADFTHLFLGEQWLRIVVPVQIMVASGVLRAISQLWVPIYNALGEPRFTFYKHTLRMLGIFLPLYPLMQMYGLEGVCWAVLIGMAASLVFDLAVTSTDRLIKLKHRLLAMRLIPILFASGVLALFLEGVLTLGPLGFASFFAVALLGGVIYLISLWVAGRLFGYSPYRDLKFFL